MSGFTNLDWKKSVLLCQYDYPAVATDGKLSLTVIITQMAV